MGSLTCVDRQPYALNEVGPGGSIVSLFNILAVMTGHAPLQLGVTAVQFVLSC